MLEVEKDYKSEPDPKIVDLSKNNIAKKEVDAPAQVPEKKNKNIIVKIQDLFDRVKEDITSPLNEYTLQVGAFGKKSNAEYQKEILINGGYDARIESVNSNGIILYTVRVGYFANHADAKRQQEKIYSRLAVNSIIIKSE